MLGGMGGSDDCEAAAIRGSSESEGAVRSAEIRRKQLGKPFVSASDGPGKDLQPLAAVLHPAPYGLDSRRMRLNSAAMSDTFAVARAGRSLAGAARFLNELGPSQVAGFGGWGFGGGFEDFACKASDLVCSSTV